MSGKIYKVFETLYCKIFGNWAFMCENKTLKEIPEELNILMNHDVAYGYADQSLQDIEWETDDHFGTIEL